MRIFSLLFPIQETNRTRLTEMRRAKTQLSGLWDSFLKYTVHAGKMAQCEKSANLVGLPQRWKEKIDSTKSFSDYHKFTDTHIKT